MSFDVARTTSNRTTNNFFERTMPGNETVMTHISKPAQFETGEPDLEPTVKCF